jgi:uncharacterized LabA/DUF88 family protein
MNQERKIAVLIDGDNADSSLIEQILCEASKFGRLTIKRIYGDWTSPHLARWKDKLNRHAIRPIQKFSYTSGKNSTDTILIIDAMDILYSNLVDGFCIVSSDSDYTGLAHRLREQGLLVTGIGRSCTPEAFVQACDAFIFTESLLTVKNEPKGKDNSDGEDKRGEFIKVQVHPLPGVTIVGQLDPAALIKKKKPRNKVKIPNYIHTAYDLSKNGSPDGVLLAKFAEELKKINPSFSFIDLGFPSFKDFCESLRHQYKLHLHEDGKTYSLKKKHISV